MRSTHSLSSLPGKRKSTEASEADAHPSEDAEAAQGAEAGEEEVKEEDPPLEIKGQGAENVD